MTTKGPDTRKALGKGLSALLPGKSAARQPSADPQPSLEPAPIPPSATGALSINITDIDPNPSQPRSVFQADRLAELAQSIRSNGVIQPIIVQRYGERYQLIAGERRWRAAQQAGLKVIPAVIRDQSSNNLLEVALIENIQREDLNAIEVAQALERLAKEYHLSHEEIGSRTGKDRVTVTNLLRLLKLPQEIQLLVSEHRISMGHARALLALTDSEQQKQLAEKVAAQGLSVRQTERMVQSLTAQRPTGERLEKPSVPVYDSTTDPNVTSATKELEAALGTRVRIVAASPERGKIEIDFFSFEELDRIYNQIIGNGAGGRS